MMVFSPINDQTYEDAANQIAYCKLFPYIIEDFLTRLDCGEMMKSTNLITQVDAGQAVATTGNSAAHTGTTVSPGQGRVSPLYIGDFKRAGTINLAKQKEAIKEAGGQATQSVLDAALGG